jgi:hypothetical protein
MCPIRILPCKLACGLPSRESNLKRAFFLRRVRAGGAIEGARARASRVKFLSVVLGNLRSASAQEEYFYTADRLPVAPTSNSKDLLRVCLSDCRDGGEQSFNARRARSP